MPSPREKPQWWGKAAPAAPGHLQTTQHGGEAKIRLCSFLGAMLKSRGTVPGLGEGVGNLVPCVGTTRTVAPQLCGRCPRRLPPACFV